MAHPAVVEVRRSDRRRRMVSARREGDTVVVFIPGWMSDSEESRWVDEMVRRLERSEARRRSPGPHGRRRAGAAAAELSRRYLEGRADAHAVRWVPPMRTRWASCTPPTARSGSASGCATCPGGCSTTCWCTSSPTCCEPGHDERFWAWVHRYPRTRAGDGLPGGALGRRRARARERRRRGRLIARRRREMLVERGSALRTPLTSLRLLVGRRPSARRRCSSGGASFASFSSSAIGSLRVGAGRRTPPGRRGRRRSGRGRGAPTARRGPSTPRCSVSSRHSSDAARSRRGRSSSPTTVANVCSAGPPEARRRRSVSRSASAPGSRSPTASATTASTQPSTSASSVSSRASAAFCSGVVSRLEHARLHGLLDRGRVARVDAAGELLDAGAVDPDAPRVLLDGAEQPLLQPRHVREEPVVGGLAGGQEDHAPRWRAGRGPW